VAVTSNTVSVTSTASRLDPDAGVGPSGSFAIRNAGTATIYLGGPNVTTSSGIPIEVGETFTADLAPNDALYGIAAAGSHDCRIMQLGAAG
jgi:hypothetical protein